MRNDLDRPPRAKQVALGLVAAVVVAVAVVVGIGRVAGFTRLRTSIEGADFQWLAVCVGGQLAVFAGYAGALRHAIASDGGPRVATGASVRLVLASFAATQLFAFGGVGGLAIVYWALRRVGMPREHAAVRVIGLSTAVYLVFAVLAWGGAAWALTAASVPLGATIPWLIGVPLVLVAARWFTQPHRQSRWNVADERPRRRALAVGIGAAAWVRRSLGRADGRPMFAWALCYWLGDVASLWAALRAFGARPALSLLIVVYCTGYLAQSLPIPFIATGGVDAATTFLLRAFGVPLDVGLAAVVTHRVFAFWLPVVPGSVFALTLPRLGRRLSGGAEHVPAMGSVTGPRRRRR